MLDSVFRKNFFLEKINQWMLKSWFFLESLAHKGYSQLILFLLAITEAIFIPIPPDVLLISLGISNSSRIWMSFINCTLGSVLGAAMSYLIGFWLWSGDTVLSQFFFEYIPGFSKHNYEYIGQLYNQYDFWLIFIAGFTPLPFKVMTITAGVFHLNFYSFIFAALVGRGLRFLIISLLLKVWGEQAGHFIKKKLNWLSLAFVLCFLICFLIFRMLF